MADRTSAALFGTFFEYLAEQPDDRAKTMAARLWKKANNYDFNWYQMKCDEALIKLDLARMGPGEDGDECIHYRQGDGWSA